MADELRDVCGYCSQYFDDYECNCMREECLANGAWRNCAGGGGGNNGGEEAEEGGGRRLLLDLLAQAYGFR